MEDVMGARERFAVTLRRNRKQKILDLKRKNLMRQRRDIEHR